MKIIIIRHGDPDNARNTLTPAGFKEVEALKKMYEDYHFDEVYVSPLNRALITANAVLEKNKIPYTICPWLEEFHHPVIINGKEENNWDFMVDYYTSHPELYNNDTYLDSDVMKSGNIKKYYNEVITEFDKILARNGYIRNGKYYEVKKSSRKVLVFFCHFGMMSVLMSHLMSIPYSLICQMFICPPTGVTTLVSEERKKGIAQFRCSGYGDISHLNKENIKPAFHGRFCEIYDCSERH